MTMNDTIYVISQIETIFDKIILVNIKNDSYKIVKDIDENITFSNSFIEQLNEYCDNYIYKDDINNFKLFIKNFRNRSNITYRKKYNNGYIWNLLEVIECKDSSTLEPKYLFLVRRVETTYSMISHNNIDYETGLYNENEFNNRLSNIDYNCYIIYLKSNDNRLITYLNAAFPNIDKYSVNDAIAMIFVGKYEDLQKSFNALSIMLKNNDIKVSTGICKHDDKISVKDANKKAYETLRKNFNK